MTKDIANKIKSNTGPLSFLQLLEVVSDSDVSIFTEKRVEPYETLETYAFRWKDVWDDKLYFKQKSIEYRAVAFSMPAIHQLKTMEVPASRVIGMTRTSPTLKIFKGKGLSWTKLI